MSTGSAAAGRERLRYDGVQIALHWLTAILVGVLYLLSEVWSFIHRGAPLRRELIGVHVSLGLALAAVLLIRILWRTGPGRRLPSAVSGLTELAAKTAHYGLYGLLIASVVFGVAWGWASHHPISLFGWVTIPTPFAFSRSADWVIGSLHNFAASCLMILAGLHAAAALFHHYVLTDDVLYRMLPAWPARKVRRAAVGGLVRETGDRSR